MDIENELTRKILDPIHGIIRLTALEIEFINHPLYQRLRNIKQNSFLYKVFPSAVHSRFEHSLECFIYLMRYLRICILILFVMEKI